MNRFILLALLLTCSCASNRHFVYGYPLDCDVSYKNKVKDGIERCYVDSRIQQDSYEQLNEDYFTDDTHSLIFLRETRMFKSRAGEELMLRGWVGESFYDNGVLSLEIFHTDNLSVVRWYYANGVLQLESIYSNTLMGKIEK